MWQESGSLVQAGAWDLGPSFSGSSVSKSGSGEERADLSAG